jgi:hypothetical protein
MSEAWDRLITEMIRHMIREFGAHPAELLTFRRVSKLVDSDADVLHAVAEQRPDLFMITSNDRFVMLFPEAVERIASDGVEKAIAEVKAAPSERQVSAIIPLVVTSLPTMRFLRTCSALHSVLNP